MKIMNVSKKIEDEISKTVSCSSLLKTWMKFQNKEEDINKSCECKTQNLDSNRIKEVETCFEHLYIYYSFFKLFC